MAEYIDREKLINDGIAKGFCDWYDEIKCAQKEDVVEREKIDKAIKIAKDSISACFELCLDERAFGMREILNIFEENIGESK